MKFRERLHKKKAAKLLSNNIRESVAGLRILLQENKDLASRGEYESTASLPNVRVPDFKSYRLMDYHPDRPPSHRGGQYAVLSYFLLASHFELQEVRPAIEEAIQFAKEEIEFFNSMDVVFDKEKGNFHEFMFKGNILNTSLYRPSLLVTATLCDPKWNVEKKKALSAKLITKEIVDWESRALENDHSPLTCFPFLANF